MTVSICHEPPVAMIRLGGGIGIRGVRGGRVMTVSTNRAGINWHEIHTAS